MLSCLFGDSTHAYSGCLDTGVRECVSPYHRLETDADFLHRLDLTTEKVTSLGQHSNSVSALSYAREISTSQSYIPLTLSRLCPARHAHLRLMGPIPPFLGPPRAKSRSIKPSTPRARLPHGHSEQHARRLHGFASVPYIRRTAHVRACADEGEQFEIYDEEFGVYG